MIEALSALVLKFTLPIASAAWGFLLAEGDLSAAAAATPVIFLMGVAAATRSRRQRGKRAEGGP